MTTRHVVERDILFLLTVSAVVGAVFAMYSAHKPNNNYSFSLPIMQNFPTPTPTSPPTPALPSIPSVETFSQVSPDGSKKLIMTVITNKTTSKTYTFTTSDGTNTNQQSIYTTTLSTRESMSIPFNTWSPDNASVFLQHNTSIGSEALVMRANGQAFPGGEQFFNVTALFTAKNTGNTYQETTGWASETLLIVNTTRPDGIKGPSYWFEIPSKAIIQLSTQF